MKKLTKGIIALWILAVLFLFTSFSFITSGEVGSFIVGLVISASLAFYGWKKYNNPPKSPVHNESSINSAHFATAASTLSKHDYVNIKVAGVTFNNGTKSRQTILRKLKFREDEFEDNIHLEIRSYEWEGKEAFGIYANDQQIGNVPTDKTSFVSENFERILAVSNIEVYGGGKNEDGEKKSYGAEITLKLKKA